MPRKDGTGPAGKGPKTGAQKGNCANTTPQPFPLDGRGEGKGKGRNRPNGAARLRRGQQTQ